MCLAVISSFCEARFYRAVVEAVNEHVGRYLLFFLLSAAGMYNASIGASLVLLKRLNIIGQDSRWKPAGLC